MRLGAFLALLLVASVPAAAGEPVWHVCFTPGQDCTGVVDREIGQARRSILVQAYSFTSRPILSALRAARARGVDVEVIVDKVAARRSAKGSRYNAATYLVNAGIPVWVDAQVAIAHNKVMVIDDSVLITGSINFTAAAQHRNAENLLVVRDRSLAASYRSNWERRRRASVAFDAEAPEPAAASERE